MQLRFYIDAETRLPHFCAHGVTETEVRQVIANPGVTIQGQGDSRLALGQTAAGRYLKVIYTAGRSWAGIFVITAYELRGKELKAYRRRRRRRLK